MPDYSKTIIIKVTEAPDSTDQHIENSLSNLQRKTNAQEVYHINQLPRFDSEALSGARIYIHGHHDYFENDFGGMQPEAVAQKLINANVSDAKLISLTGCNSARGRAVRMEANKVKLDLYQRYKDQQMALKHAWDTYDPNYENMYKGPLEDPKYPGITTENVFGHLPQDSRLVDTNKSAMELCLGSFAQVFHKSLMDAGLDIDVHARLFVVSIDEDADGNVRKTTQSSILVDDEVSPANTLYCVGHKAEKSKIKISKSDEPDGGASGQEFAYVDYTAAENDAAAATPPAGGS